MPEQQPFTSVEFPDNPEPRCPCLLLLDVSGSMSGNPIKQLEDGVQQCIAEIRTDPLAAKRVELGIITFGGNVTVTQNFATVDAISSFSLDASGDTPMGAAIIRGLELLRERMALYRTHGNKPYKPWLFLMTDGAPTDSGLDIWSKATQQLHEGCNNREFNFFPIAVQNADLDTLRGLSPGREPIQLQGLKFRELFIWISSSLRAASASRPGESIKLESVDTWANVSL